MARLPRLAVAGLPHWVLQRSRDELQVFAEEADAAAYLQALAAVIADGTLLRVHAWALTPTAARLVVTPATAQALGQVMQRVGRRFVPAFNARHGRRGSPWEGRFRATVLEADAYLLAAMRHVERAPVRLGLAQAAEDYRWSSAAHHAGRRRDPLVQEHRLYWQLGNTPFEREMAYGRLPVDDAAAEALEAAGRKGWALGGPGFAASLSKLTPRRAAPLPKGRKRGSS